MKLSTSRFGEVDIEEDKIVTFTQGLPGFETVNQFIMLQPDENIPFTFMQAISDGDLAFLVTNPFLYFPDYSFDLPLAVENELSIEKHEDVTICAVVSIREDVISLNLLAPIILNSKQKKGKQVILHQSEYKTKHVINNTGIDNEAVDVKGE